MLRLIPRKKRQSMAGDDDVLFSDSDEPYLFAGDEEALPKSALLTEETFTSWLGCLREDLKSLTGDVKSFLRTGWPVALTLFVMIAAFAWLWNEPKGVYAGVSILGTPVGGFTLPELRQEVNQMAQNHTNSSLSFTVVVNNVPQYTKTIPLKKLIPHGDDSPYKVRMTVATAYLVGRQLDWRSRLSSRWHLFTSHDIDVPMPVNVDSQRLAAFMKELSHKPIDASVRLVGAHLRVVPSKNGYVVDADQQSVEDAIAVGQTSIDITAHEVNPKFEMADLQNFTVRSIAAIPETSRTKGAHVNAQLAVNHLRHVVMLPGQTISLNSLIGERTAQKGYLPAPIFLSDEKVGNGIGGGICYVSTAVFQAAVRGGLQIVERHNHSRRVTYTKPGLDAALYWNAKDLKIKNSGNTPVVLVVKVRNQHVVASVLGSPLTDSIKMAVTNSKPDHGHLHVNTYVINDTGKKLAWVSNYRM